MMTPVPNNLTAIHSDYAALLEPSRRLRQDWEAMRRAMLAMLAQALTDLYTALNTSLSQPYKRFPHAVSARAWVLGQTGTPEQVFFHYTTVCDVLGIDPGALRRKLHVDGALEWEKRRPDMLVVTAQGKVRHYVNKLLHIPPYAIRPRPGIMDNVGKECAA